VIQRGAEIRHRRHNPLFSPLDELTASALPIVSGPVAARSCVMSFRRRPLADKREPVQTRVRPDVIEAKRTPMPAASLGTYSISPIDGGWLVTFNAQPDGQVFVRYSTALFAAKDAALARWEVFGLKTKVLVTDVDGRTVVESNFGPDDPADPPSR
jgi:hypothetical protein